MIIQVAIREVFGVLRYYPINDNARAIIELMNKKTLNEEHLDICRKYGWVVQK